MLPLRRYNFKLNWMLVTASYTLNPWLVGETWRSLPTFGYFLLVLSFVILPVYSLSYLLCWSSLMLAVRVLVKKSLGEKVSTDGSTISPRNSIANKSASERVSRLSVVQMYVQTQTRVQARATAKVTYTYLAECFLSMVRQKNSTLYSATKRSF